VARTPEEVVVYRILSLAIALTLLPSPALACGGMFCDAVQPVDQAAERIVFAWAEDDECDDGLVTVEVQIAYTGDADEFAWVVPVPDIPDLFVSNDALFDVLANGTIPTHSLVRDAGECSAFRSGEGDVDTDVDTDSDTDSDLGEGGVAVIARETVGPYDTVVLQATNSGVLVEWLQEQGYAIPSDLEPVLAPYLAEQQYFVALKLASDEDAGNLSPLGMTYCGRAASIPIRLTSVAAIPDLPIEVFVLGPTRAVPDNYLHVRINEAAIDWYAGGTNYRDVVKRAADEAAGQAFATDFSGSTAAYANRIWRDGMVDVVALQQAKTSVEWLSEIGRSSLPPSSQLTALLTAWAPAPAGVDQTDFLRCPECYAHKVSGPFDAGAATDALESEILDALASAQALVDAAPHLTRLFTTMDASEMTMDPLFVFNPDVEQNLASSHTATSEYHCGLFGDDPSGATRYLVLADGRRIHLPSEDWMADHGVTELEYMDELTSPAAIVIENLGASGPGEIILDYRNQAADEAAAFGQDSEGCACTTIHRRSLAAAVLFLAALAAVRRTRGDQ
jgi:hypothetical protein